jgi:hypothetical protein
MLSLVDQAQFALKHGFVPIPLNGKVPIPKGWQNTKMSDALEQVKRYSSRANNIGIVTGRVSDVVVVDIDPDGLPMWYELVRLYEEPQTFKVRTGRGGYHYYFTYASTIDRVTGTKLLTTNKIAKTGMDFRSDGGQIVFPFGSKHPDTGVYYQALNDVCVNGMPMWLLMFIYNNSACMRKR